MIWHVVALQALVVGGSVPAHKFEHGVVIGLILVAFFAFLVNPARLSMARLNSRTSATTACCIIIRRGVGALDLTNKLAALLDKRSRISRSSYNHRRADCRATRQLRPGNRRRQDHREIPEIFRASKRE